MSTESARVELLTATVRVLMVGSRQVTLSVARQLDRVELVEVDPFGRIRLERGGNADLVIGRNTSDGALVTAWINWNLTKDYAMGKWGYDEADWNEFAAARLACAKLPLIVLAGLR